MITYGVTITRHRHLWKAENDVYTYYWSGAGWSRSSTPTYSAFCAYMKPTTKLYVVLRGATV